jgi:hypothetical protein
MLLLLLLYRAQALRVEVAAKLVDGKFSRPAPFRTKPFTYAIVCLYMRRFHYSQNDTPSPVPTECGIFFSYNYARDSISRTRGTLPCTRTAVCMLRVTPACARAIHPQGDHPRNSKLTCLSNHTCADFFLVQYVSTSILLIMFASGIDHDFANPL